jgi:hypothetical protein
MVISQVENFQENLKPIMKKENSYSKIISLLILKKYIYLPKRKNIE